MTHPAETFRALHQPGNPFVMVNVWDRGSAIVMQSLGAKALATSSAAYAYTLGRPDGGTVDRDESLAHAQHIVSATSLPVQGDFENGFGDDPDTCAQTVRMAAEVGLAGICIEDTMFPSGDPYPFDLAVERMRAASAAARALPHDFIFTARADGLMTGAYDTDEGVRRIAAFADAGADCLYAPMPADMAALARITAATDKPVNALAAGPYTAQTLADFAAINVARMSIGSALARVTHRAIYDAGRAMIGDGHFDMLGNGISGDTIDALLTKE